MSVLSYPIISLPLTAHYGDPVESVPEVVLVSVITDGAEVIVGALGTLPPEHSVLT